LQRKAYLLLSAPLQLSRTKRGTHMVLRISVTNTPPDGVRWHVIEQGKILRAGTATTELHARATAIKAIKEIETERFVSATSSGSSVPG
jgi:hypothetical protein